MPHDNAPTFDDGKSPWAIGSRASWELFTTIAAAVSSVAAENDGDEFVVCDDAIFSFVSLR